MDILNTVSHMTIEHCHMIPDFDVIQFAQHGGVQAIADVVLKTENITVEVSWI